MSLKEQLKKIANAPKKKAMTMMKNFILSEMEAKMKKKHTQYALRKFSSLTFVGMKGSDGKDRGKMVISFETGNPVSLPMNHDDVQELKKIAPSLNGDNVVELILSLDFINRKIDGKIREAYETEGKVFEF